MDPNLYERPELEARLNGLAARLSLSLGDHYARRGAWTQAALHYEAAAAAFLLDDDIDACIDAYNREVAAEAEARKARPTATVRPSVFLD